MPIPHARLAFAAAALAASTVALTGCSTIAALQDPPVQADYRSWPTDAKTDGPQPPAFVPHDATAMYVRVRPTDGAAILTYTSETPPSGCTPGPLTGRPRLDSNWWPVEKPPAEGTLCPSGWRLFTVDGVTYGWRPGSPQN